MNDDQPYGEPSAIRKEKQRPCCPRCLNLLRQVDDGWCCPKHGIQDVKVEKK